MGSVKTNPPRRENPWISLLFNIGLPVLLLTQGDRFIPQPAVVLIIALAFPTAYFIYDYKKRRKTNFISILGFVSVLLTGGVGLLELPRKYFIIKETAIPAIIGLAVLASLLTRYPLIRALVFSPEIFDVEKIQRALAYRQNQPAMDRLLRRATVFLSLSFFLSAVLNYLLASFIVRTDPAVDSAAFNAEVGAMTGWSYVVIAVPSMAVIFAILAYVAKGIHRLAGLAFEEALAEHLR